MNERWIVLRTFGVVLSVGMIMMAMHIGLLGFAKRHRRLRVLETMGGFLGVILLGLVVLWQAVGPEIPLTLRVGAGCLYLAGAILYVQLRSVLSRGYSLRILVDLLGQPHAMDVEQLQTSYGNGKGLAGLLRRRVESLAEWGLMTAEGDQVGPLTLAGRVIAGPTLMMRRLLRMEHVG